MFENENQIAWGDEYLYVRFGVEEKPLVTSQYDLSVLPDVVDDSCYCDECRHYGSH